MKYPEHPEWSDDTPAIDGISSGENSAIRGDVREILEWGNEKFEAWYSQHIGAVRGLLETLELAGEVPDLHYVSQENSLGGHYLVGELTKKLKKAELYLNRMMQVREEAREGRS